MITALDHIAIAVRSIEEARTFYENLGLSVAGIEEVEHEGAAGRDDSLRAAAGSNSWSRCRATRRSPGSWSARVRAFTTSASRVTTSTRTTDACAGTVWSSCASGPGRAPRAQTVQFVHPKSAGGVLVELSEPAS